MSGYIEFLETGGFKDKKTFSIRNKKSGAEIGQIGWYPRWKRHVAHFEDASVWSDDCLEAVAKFLRETTT